MTNPSSKPTGVRHIVIIGLTLSAIVLYLDRYSISIALEYVREDLHMTQSQISWLISAFFWSYALCQVPAGWLSDRLGSRRMMCIYIIGWSATTALMGFVAAGWMLLWLRLLFGITQAGAYPTSAALIRKWIPLSRRGRASSIVSLGGRFGGFLAPILTAWLIIWSVPIDTESQIDRNDILNDDAFLAAFSTDELDSPRERYVAQFMARLPEADRERIEVAGRAASERVAAKAKIKPARRLLPDFNEWLPSSKSNESLKTEDASDGLAVILDQLGATISKPDGFDFQAISVQISQRVDQLRRRRDAGKELTVSETARLNREAIESLFPESIRKVCGPGWRQTMMLYGILGAVITVPWILLSRNGPEEHPWCNDAERALIAGEGNTSNTSPRPAAAPKFAFPWRVLLTTPSLWAISGVQFMQNIGWLFVAMQLPTYLSSVHKVPLDLRGVMTSFPMGVSIIGIFAGGRFTDWAMHRFGLKLGRRIPLLLAGGFAASGYGFCLLFSSIAPQSDRTWLPWLFVAAFCVAAFSNDFGIPATWSFAQDVGGKFTASILGWGNMWGNLGAACAPLIYNYCLGENPTLSNWNTMFAVCGGAFLIAGCCASIVDASKPIKFEDVSKSDAN